MPSHHQCFRHSSLNDASSQQSLSTPTPSLLDLLSRGLQASSATGSRPSSDDTVAFIDQALEVVNDMDEEIAFSMPDTAAIIDQALAIVSDVDEEEIAFPGRPVDIPSHKQKITDKLPRQ